MPDRDIVLLLLSALIMAGLLLWAAIFMIDQYFIAALPISEEKAMVNWLRPAESA